MNTENTKDEKKYVPNDVYVFEVMLKYDVANTDVTVYTAPMQHNEEDLVQEKYFTKERIAELKRKLIERIMECENPFYIECTDYDGDYNVTEEQLFKMD